MGEDTLRDIFRLIEETNQRRREKTVRVCPRCGSVRVQADDEVIQSLGLLPERFICRNCSHAGMDFPEIPVSEVDAFSEDRRDVEPDKTELVDFTYGRFETHIMWKITGPSTMLFGIGVYSNASLTGSLVFLLGLFMSYVGFIHLERFED